MSISANKRDRRRLRRSADVCSASAQRLLQAAASPRRSSSAAYVGVRGGRCALVRTFFGRGLTFFVRRRMPPRAAFLFRAPATSAVVRRLASLRRLFTLSSVSGSGSSLSGSGSSSSGSGPYSCPAGDRFGGDRPGREPHCRDRQNRRNRRGHDKSRNEIVLQHLRISEHSSEGRVHAEASSSAGCSRSPTWSAPELRTRLEVAIPRRNTRSGRRLAHSSRKSSARTGPPRPPRRIPQEPHVLFHATYPAATAASRITSSGWVPAIRMWSSKACWTNRASEHDHPGPYPVASWSRLRLPLEHSDVLEVGEIRQPGSPSRSAEQNQ